MELKKELEAFAQEMSKNAPAEVLEIIGNEIGKLSVSGIVERALKVGDTAPDFKLDDSNGTTISLDAMVALGPAVISFNRGNWCPFCNITFKHLQKSVREIETNGSNLFVISPQLKEKSAQLKKDNGYEYPILYDKGNELAEKFGISFSLPEVLRPIHKAFEMDIPAHNGDESYNLPIPATYVINSDKKIVYAHVNPNWMERAEPTEYLKMD